MSRARLEVPVAGGVARFDVDPEEVAVAGPEQVSRRGHTTVARLDESLDEALAAARPAAEAVIGTFTALAPDELIVEFGLRLDAEAGAVFAKAGVGAHFTVSLKWAPSVAAR
jgi:Trypsin-co-occurring domain 1